MFESTISGIVFFLIAVFFGPALIMAGFQMMGGQKVHLASLLKPFIKVICMLGEMVWETAEVVANMVAENLPKKYAPCKPLVAAAVKLAIVGILVWIVVTFLGKLAVR